MTTSVSNSTATGTTAAATTSKVAKPSLGKDDFLKLLVAQLQNQDPLNPSDPTAFTAQLAQFSSLEQLTTVNDNLVQMAKNTNSQAIDRLSSFALIGRQVEVKGPTFKYSNAPVAFGYTLDSAASAVTVKILDDKDQVVAVLPQASNAAGSHDYSWDGTMTNGKKAAAGAYHLQIERTDKGQATLVDSRITGLVSGVDLSNASGSVMNTSIGDYSLADVVQVKGS